MMRQDYYAAALAALLVIGYLIGRHFLARRAWRRFIDGVDRNEHPDENGEAR